MKKFKYQLASLIVFLFSTSVNSADCRSLTTFGWLKGEWISKSSSSTTSESWRKVSEVTLEGIGVTEQNDANKPKTEETLRLVEMSDQVFYIAKVGHNELPVAFEAVSCGKNNVTFENLKHDFPKRLVYQLLAEDKMSVTVSDAQDKGFVIHFSKQR
jgi:hypothetical protein